MMCLAVKATAVLWSVCAPATLILVIHRCWEIDAVVVKVTILNVVDYSLYRTDKEQ